MQCNVARMTRVVTNTKVYASESISQGITYTQIPGKIE